jgi:tetratricopeptide (TPR) repeat protein
MELLGRAGLRVARRLGDEAAEAYALGDLAGLHFLTGRQSEALHLTDSALTIWRRLGVVSWMRRCLNNRGLLLEGLGRYAESGRTLRQSLEYSRQLNDPYGEAVTYSHLGNLYEHTDPRAAIEQHRRSLAIGDRIGNVIVQHSAHCNIGYAHLTLGEPAAAATHFEESLRILGGHGDWHGESQTRLGLVRACWGRPAAPPGSAPCSWPAPTPEPTASRAAWPATSTVCCCGSRAGPRRRTPSGAPRCMRWTERTRRRCCASSGNCWPRPAPADHFASA